MNRKAQVRRRTAVWGIALLVMVGLGWLGWRALARPAAETPQAGLTGLPTAPITAGGLAGYDYAHGPGELAFPRDFGPHPGFLTEWWYYTGSLAAADGRQFGYQLTFFRRAVQPPGAQADRASNWATQQVYMAHFTLTDVSAGQFHAFERFERGGVGLAGAALTPEFQVWLQDWSVTQVGPRDYRLKAQADGAAVDLTLTDVKGPVLQGDRGYSQKGPPAGPGQPAPASNYFSQPRLETRGTLTAGGQAYPVTGQSWMDREISTSALSQGQVGWDWFSLQLDDGSELMAYVLRRADGSIDRFSSGTYIRPDGQTVPLSQADFEITAQTTWKSPHTGGVYPAGWTVRVPGQNLELTVKPLLADQELNVSYSYWEGAVAFGGTHAGRPVTGRGYVELTGYSKPMQGTL